MVFNCIGTYRTESAKTYMQCNECNIDAFIPDTFKNFIREMKPCCRCSCRTTFFRKHCLITCLIIKRLRNIRRQRHFSERIQNFIKDPVIDELECAATLFQDTRTFCFQTIRRQM